jgi:urea transport system substrate-binding protein
VAWDSGKPVRPIPFPHYRSKDEWNAFLSELYVGWGRRWAKPGT